MPHQRCRLEQLARFEHLTLADFCDRFARAGTEIGEKAHVSPRQAKRWLAGDNGLPRPQACRVLEHWWGESVAVLFGPPRDQGSTPAQVTLEEFLMTTGHESADHALDSATALAPTAVEALHADVGRLARVYYTAAPLVLLGQLVRLRNTVYAQLDRTQSHVSGPNSI